MLQRNTSALAEAVDLASGCIDVVCMPLCYVCMTSTADSARPRVPIAGAANQSMRQSREGSAARAVRGAWMMRRKDGKTPSALGAAGRPEWVRQGLGIPGKAQTHAGANPIEVEVGGDGTRASKIGLRRVCSTSSRDTPIDLR